MKTRQKEMTQMSENWIRVGKTDYFIKSDRLNWIVARQIKCEKCKSFPDGRKLVHETYHNDLKGAFKRIFEETTKLAEAKTMQDILRVCEETYAMLKRVLEYDFKDLKSAA
jgi:hypothetical protein